MFAFKLLFGTVVDEARPEDEPDQPASPEHVEHGFPAEGVAKDAADRQWNDGAHLKQNIQ